MRFANASKNELTTCVENKLLKTHFTVTFVKNVKIYIKLLQSCTGFIYVCSLRSYIEFMYSL